MVGRELTKVHQEFIHGTAGEVAQKLSSPRGEFTVVLGPYSPPQQQANDLIDGDVAAEFGKMADLQGLSRREAVAAVAKKLGKTSREVYAAIERTKKSVQ